MAGPSLSTSAVLCLFRAGELGSFACQLYSAQIFALPGNFGSAPFVLKFIIESVQGLCGALGWPASA